MSILRLSCDRDLLFAPDAKGNLCDKGYEVSTGIGLLGTSEYRDGDPSPMHASLAVHLDAAVKASTKRLNGSSPVVVMVHGFLFNPYEKVLTEPKDCDNPHGRIYHFGPVDPLKDAKEHITPWPLQLGFADDDEGLNGLAVAFGWYSNPGFAMSLLAHFQNFYSRAYEYGTKAAWSLVRTLQQLDRSLGNAGKDQPIDLFCHSLGSHVVIEALLQAATLVRTRHAEAAAMKRMLERIGRVILLGGAEYVQRAQAMYQELTAPMPGAGSGKKPMLDAWPTFYNVGSRENDVLDTLAENFGPRFFGNSQVIGHNGLAFREPRRVWLDLQIDGARLRQWAKRRGLDILGDGPGTWDHWYYYTHPGNMAMYREMLRERDAWEIAALRRARIPEGFATSLFGN